MVLNNKGQVIFYTMMVGVVVMIFALAISPVVMDFVDSARNETNNVGGVGLNCSSPTLSDYDKGACMILDITPMYFIGVLILIGGIIAGAKILIEHG